MTELHDATRRLLVVAAATRPSRADWWKGSPLERAVGNWVQAGCPDVDWEFQKLTGGKNGASTDTGKALE